MDNQNTYVEANKEEPTEYRIGRFVVSLVCLIISLVFVVLVIGSMTYDYPEYSEDMGGLQTLEWLSMIFLNGVGVLASFTYIFIFSLIGFLCGITSLKRLPNKATKVIAIISTVMNGILNACAMIPAALFVFAIFRLISVIGI